ncbi:MAG: RluA family pseudouridine synthase, partial [Gemmatimonadetes bacterium]|nr:RluA family pseudouridine synthase [Gemmatimonadota bacterium]
MRTGTPAVPRPPRSGRAAPRSAATRRPPPRAAPTRRPPRSRRNPSPRMDRAHPLERR